LNQRYAIMIKAFAPRESGGCSRVLLSIVLVSGFPLVVDAQTTKAGNPPAPGQTAPAAPATKADANANARAHEPNAAPAGAGAEQATAQIEILRDAHVQNCMPNTFPQLGKAGNEQTIRAIRTMSGGGMAADRATIERFVNGCIYDLTDKNNI